MTNNMKKASFNKRLSPFSMDCAVDGITIPLQ